MSSEKWFEDEINEMVVVVAGAKNPQEIVDLFEYILTPREINDMAKRLKILKMLSAGCSYCEIQRRLMVSSSLIGRLSYHVGYGFRRSNNSGKRVGDRKVSNILESYLRSPKLKYKGITTFIPRS